jgi:hypothetical protein
MAAKVSIDGRAGVKLVICALQRRKRSVAGCPGTTWQSALKPFPVSQWTAAVPPQIELQTRERCLWGVLGSTNEIIMNARAHRGNPRTRIEVLESVTRGRLLPPT